MIMIYKITLILLALAGLIGSVAALYGVSTFSTLKRTEIANEARYQCTQSSRYEVTQKDGAIVWYPVEELYQKCLKEKGV